VGQVKEISLTQDCVALVDDEDYDRVNALKWHVRRTGKTAYASHSLWLKEEKRYTQIHMHRFIVNAPLELDVDHVDGDGLNNTRQNLRPATRSQNVANRHHGNTSKSGFIGVKSHYKRWKARIGSYNRKNAPKHLGSFVTPEEAARAYDKAAKERYGEFAKLNFPEEKERL